MRSVFCAMAWAVLCGFGLVGLAPVAQAAAPNFTGYWELSIADSDFGTAPKPKAAMLKITQGDGALVGESITSVASGESRHRFRWTLDGAPSSNPYRGMNLVTTATWRGPMLHAKSKLEAQGNTLTMVDQYSLSPEGNTLTIYRSLVGPNGEFEQKSVYRRSSAEKFPSPSQQ